MNFMLNDADGRAVDAMFELKLSKLSIDGVAQPADPDQLAQRLRAASKLFKLLETLPAVEPPADLVQRTLDNVRIRSYGQSPTTGDRAPLGDGPVG